MDSFGSLSVFMRAAETRNFTEAARQLSVSSSSIGKSVARLEESLGVRLFHRNTRSIALTQDGELLLESCRRIFSEVRAVESCFARYADEPKGRLKVSLPLIGMLMMPMLGNFIRKHPGVELDLDFTDRIVDVVEGGYDVVVRTGEVADSRLMARRLGTYRMQIVGAPSYFARSGFPRHPQDLEAHACLHHRHPATGKLRPWPFDEAVEVELPVTAAASAIEAVIGLATSAVGIACVPDFLAATHVADGSLTIVLDEHVGQAVAFRALWPSSRHLAPTIRSFVDFLAENLLPRGSAYDTEEAASRVRGPGATIDAGIVDLGRRRSATFVDSVSLQV